MNKIPTYIIILFRSRVFFLLCSFIFYSGSVFSTNFYVDPSSISSTANGSLLNPWKAISQVNSYIPTLKPGDTVFFKRGQQFRGNIIITIAGTEANPIVFTSYGLGSPPEMISTGAPIFLLRGARNIKIDGFKIFDPSISDSLHIIQARIPYGIILKNAPNCIIKNCDISKVGIGISVEGGSDQTTIEDNFIHDLRMVRNTPITMNSNDDYGANPMVIGSSRNTIRNNRFEECWARSYDYGFDGGAVELFGASVNDNKVFYNTAINCNGFLEIGSQGNGSALNNIVAYNKIINCGAIGVIQNAGSFKVDVRNLQYYNNTVIETAKQYSRSSSLFWMAATGSQGMVTVKNNLFWLSSGVNFVNSRFSSGQMIHSNNIYRMSSGSLGYSLGSTEQFSATANHFTAASGNPVNWNLELLPLSTAINAGTDLGLKQDFRGKSILNAPDIGILEYHPFIEKVPLIATANLSRIKCNGDSAELQITAKGGSPPYLGIGNYSVKAGRYNYWVKDKLGDSTSISILVEEPTPISHVYEIDSIHNEKALYRLSVTANGGISPYMFSINETEYQPIGLFDSVSSGENIVNVIDSIGCIKSLSVILDENSVNHQIIDLPFISIRPNPSNGNFLLLLNRAVPSTPYSIDIYDSMGRIVLSAHNYREEILSFGSNFSPGIYFVRVFQGRKSSDFRAIKL